MYFKLSLFIIFLSIYIGLGVFLEWGDFHQKLEFVGEVCSDEIKQAMNKMGPEYDYIMKGETLYVDKGDGKWLRLRYERR